MTAEVLEGIKFKIASAVHLQMLVRLTREVRQHPGGEQFLRNLAVERRAEAAYSTAPALHPAMSDLMASTKQDVVQEMLHAMGL